MHMKPMKQKLGSLILAIALALSLAAPASAADSLPFTDVQEGQWFHPYVQDLYDAGIVNGVTATLFQPTGTVTFGQALKLVLLAADYETQAPTSGHWASGFYDLAQREDCLPAGLDLGLDEPISRLEIAALIVETLDLSRTSQAPSPFADTDAEAALILWDHGIFEGTTANGQTLFYPQDNISRAEVSAVIYRLYQYEPPEEPGGSQEEEGDYFYFGNKKVYVVEEMPKQSYDSSLFQQDENGFLTYDSDEYSCRIGIDVSRYQGEIDWAAVKDAGVEFAMLRLGYRGYSTGKIVTDAYFETNLQGALENGIEVGVYFFSQAITVEEGLEEAKLVLDTLQGRELDFPVVFDQEEIYEADARTDNLDPSTASDIAVAFCDAVKDGGYNPMIYANTRWFVSQMDFSRLDGYSKWLAQYYRTPFFPYQFQIWQYTSSGSVDGIQGNVDLNLCFTTDF